MAQFTAVSGAKLLSKHLIKKVISTFKMRPKSGRIYDCPSTASAVSICSKLETICTCNEKYNITIRYALLWWCTVCGYHYCQQYRVKSKFMHYVPVCHSEYDLHQLNVPRYYKYFLNNKVNAYRFKSLCNLWLKVTYSQVQFPQAISHTCTLIAHQFKIVFPQFIVMFSLCFCEYIVCFAVLKVRQYVVLKVLHWVYRL